MTIDIIAAAGALSDRDLLARLDALAGQERRASVELVAHLAVLDARPEAYAAQGYGSLFTYCTQALHLSEDAACNRIEAAKACRRFPVLLELLASGSLTLTAVKMLSRHLTAENFDAVLERAKGQSCRQVEALIVELAPRPDAAASVRKLPKPTPPIAPTVAEGLPIATDVAEHTSAPHRSVHRLGRSSNRLRLIAIGFNSRSGRKPTTGFGACRRFYGGRSRTAIQARSSTVR